MIIQPLNLVHILTILIIPTLCFLAINYGLRHRSEAAQIKALTIICIVNAFLYFVYKIAKANDPSSDFDIFYNLPLHFCNINLILLPVAIKLKSKCLMAYQYYFGTALAALAILVVDDTFRGQSIFGFTALVYFYYHSMLIIIPLALAKFGLFRPSFKLVWQPAALLVVLTGVIHLVNVAFRATGLAEGANYFFTFGLRGNILTEIFWWIIPYPFFFLIPSIITFVPYIIVLTLPFYKRK